MGNEHDKLDRVEFSGRPIQHGWDESQRPSMAIVEAVAAVTGREPTELPPLQRSVDTDGLDSLLMGAADGTHAHFTFEYGGVGVAIDAAGGLTVWPDGLESDSRDSFDERLGALLRAAAGNGTPVAGGYEVRAESDQRDWEVTVTEVKKRRDS